MPLFISSDPYGYGPLSGRRFDPFNPEKIEAECGYWGWTKVEKGGRGKTIRERLIAAKWGFTSL